MLPPVFSDIATVPLCLQPDGERENRARRRRASLPRNIVKGIDSILQVLLDERRNRSHRSRIFCRSYVEAMKSLPERDNTSTGASSSRLTSGKWTTTSPRRSIRSAPTRTKFVYSTRLRRPHYKRLIDGNVSIREYLIRLILEPNARLKDEAPSYPFSEISKIGNVHETFPALAN